MNGFQTNAELDAAIIEHDAREGERVMTALMAFLGRFVSYPSEHARIAHALWIIHTHLMDRWDSTPRLAFLSAEPASGKTRALEITELVVPKPVATVNVTPAYLFRKVAEEGSATILFDEIDTVFGPRAKDNEDIRGLLNAGHRRGATTGRCVMRGREVLTEELPAYAAVALAGIGWLPDTLLSRSIIIRMRRRRPEEHIESFRRRVHDIQGAIVRERVSTWAAGAGSSITWPELPSQIDDRDADMWEPLIAIADALGGSWPDRARSAGVSLVAASKEVEVSLGIKLLADLQRVFVGSEQLASKTILQGLYGLEESPWSDIKGKPLDERNLARRLAEYGVKPKTLRIGTATPRGYLRSDLADVWSRYVVANSTTTKTSATGMDRWNASEATRGQDVSDVVPVLLSGADIWMKRK
jgi:hypothetical protein